MKNIDLQNDSKLTNGFKIPEDYFESFEHKLMNRIEQLPPKTIPLQSFWRKKQLWVGIAALFIISLGILHFWPNQSEYNPSAQDYLAYDNELTIDELADHLTEEDIQKIESDLTLADADTEKYINEYLN
ncbi:hypothetical protein [Flavobacterium sp.]|uniref:hypothetical protein n=1 Tax=Flavobacterium sp. TaxID=239 RepID=UPI003D0E8E96